MTPSSPSSSPAKSIGTPGSVNWSPAATRWTAASPPTTVRMRAESWEPRMFQLAQVARQPSVPCQARKVSTTSLPPRRGTGTGRPKARAGEAGSRSHDQTGQEKPE